MSDTAAPAEAFRDRAVLFLERGSIVWLLIFAAFATHSIAVTQISASAALLFTLVGLVVRREFRWQCTAVDLALIGFTGWTVLSAILSIEPRVSTGKLGQTSLFLILYLFATQVRDTRIARTMVILLVVSCQANVAYTFYQRWRGRGIEITSISQDSPLGFEFRFRKKQNKLKPGDVLMELDGQRLRSLDDLRAAMLRSHEPPPVLVMVRKEMIKRIKIAPQDRAAILEALERSGAAGLGLRVEPGRQFRASGFYGMYATYAEVLQWIASLIIALLLVLKKKWSPPGVLLMLALLGVISALILTLTRAVWIGLVFSVVAIAALSGRKRFAVAALASLLIAAPIALFLLSQFRGVTLLDPSDPSTTWRLEVWHDASKILLRHPLFGVGADSLRLHWQEWGLFENGKLPLGHLHSTPLQLAFERGIPALALYAWMMAIFFRTVWRLAKRLAKENDWILHGAAIGIFGGLVGFNVSSLVHYNFGDSEVVMMLWMMLGLAFALDRLFPSSPAKQRI